MYGYAFVGAWCGVDLTVLQVPMAQLASIVPVCGFVWFAVPVCAAAGSGVAAGVAGGLTCVPRPDPFIHGCIRAYCAFGDFRVESAMMCYLFRCARGFSPPPVGV